MKNADFLIWLLFILSLLSHFSCFKLKSKANKIKFKHHCFSSSVKANSNNKNLGQTQKFISTTRSMYYPKYVSSFYGAHRNLMDTDGFKRINNYSFDNRKEIIHNHNEKVKKTYKDTFQSNNNVALKIIKD